MRYKKYRQVFFKGNDTDYKHLSGIKVWSCDESDKEYMWRVRREYNAKNYFLVIQR